jgi:hypothetical protein
MQQRGEGEREITMIGEDDIRGPRGDLHLQNKQKNTNPKWLTGFFSSFWLF